MCGKYRRAAAVEAAIAALMFNGCAVKPKTCRVGILSGSDAFLGAPNGFQAKMAELGCVEGLNIVYDMHAYDAASIADMIFNGTSAGKILVLTPASRLRLNHKLAREVIR
jgi:hypothetical protein